MPAEGRENPLLKKGNSDAFFREKYLTKNRIQGIQRFRQRYAGLSMAELLKAVWNIDLALCPKCGCTSMQQLGRSHAPFP